MSGSLHASRPVADEVSGIETNDPSDVPDPHRE